MPHRRSGPIPRTDVAFTSGVVPVLVTTTVVVGNNPARTEITVVNTSANIIDLAFATAESGTAPAPTIPTAPTAVAGSGLRLAAGASWTSQSYTGPIAAIAQTATSNLTVAEF